MPRCSRKLSDKTTVDRYNLGKNPDVTMRINRATREIDVEGKRKDESGRVTHRHKPIILP